MLPLQFVLLAVVAFFVCFFPVSAADKTVVSLAHIRLTGQLDESPVGTDPLFGVSGENFKTKLDRIRKAREDASIQALYLQIDELRVGWGKIDELRSAIAEFRKAGKKTYAYLESGGGKEYVLATACDEVLLPESGWLMLTGLRAEVTFYKDLLSKIGIKADLLQMGDFKGAAEPYTRSKMSPQLKKQLEIVLDDYYENGLIDTLIKSRPSRKWTPKQVKKLIDQGPYTAKAALAAGLIDRVAYADQFQSTLKTALKADELKIVEHYARVKAEEIDFSNPLNILKLLSPPKPTKSKKPKVAVIYAVGAIVTGKGGESLFGGKIVGSTTMIEAIRQAEMDDTVKALVLRVDSPGGSALASDLIWNELRRSKKPVIASMSDTAASGGYYISMAAQKIYAEPGTLTGSIGVVGGKMVLGDLYGKVGLNSEIITRGANANLFSLTTPFSDSERKAVSGLMKEVYDQFLDKAAEGRKKAGRKMTRDELEQLAGGRIWTGRQAMKNGLVDELGTLEDAVAWAWKQAKMPKDVRPELLILPKPRNFFDMLLDLKADAKLSDAQFRIPLPELPDLTRKFRGLEGLLHLRGEPVWTLLPVHMEIR